jgi:hypothetical protein
LLVPVFALVLAAGCGGGGGGDNGESQAAIEADLRLKDEAAAKTKREAAKVVNATRDKYVPGPKKLNVLCIRRGDPGAGPDVPPNALKCHVDASYDAYRGKPAGYLTYEDWIVPITNGKLGTPVIAGAFNIRNFLREDNKRNCTGRHRPSECQPKSQGGILAG